MISARTVTAVLLALYLGDGFVVLIGVFCFWWLRYRPRGREGEAEEERKREGEREGWLRYLRM